MSQFNKIVPLGLVCLLFGCSADPSENSSSINDSLAEMQRSREAIQSTPAPVDSGSHETSPPMNIKKGTEDSNADLSDAEKTGSFKVRFETSAGDFVVLVHRDWAPVGARRFQELVSDGFYDECRFFRVVPGFMVQFGINGSPPVQRKWERRIADDKVVRSNQKGYVTFATSGPNSRTTQIFINYAHNHFLDDQGFSPFGEVIEGMPNVEGIYSGHGENPDQGQINGAGNEYLKRNFPELDYVKKATIVEE